MAQFTARWRARFGLPDSGRARRRPGPVRRFVLELFIATAILSVATVLGLCWLLEPAGSGSAALTDRQSFLLGRSLLASFVVMALAVLVIGGRMRETEASQRTLHQLLEAARDGILMTNRQGQLVMVNSQIERMFGYSRAELLGQPMSLLVPHGLHEVYADFDQGPLVQSGRDSTGTVIELLGRCKDGRTLAIEVSLSSLETEDGLLILSISRDISERKQAEEALQQVAAEYRSMVENLLEGIVQLTPQGQFLNANRTAARMLGYESSAELLTRLNQGQQPLYVDPECVSKLKRLLDQRGAVQGFEAEVYRRDGSKIWIALSLRVISEPSGARLHYEGTLADITERRLAQEALQQSQQSLSNLLRNLPGLVYRRRNDPQWTADFLSDGCLDLLGYHPTEMIGNWKISYLQLIHADDRALVWEQIQAALQAGTPFQLTYRIRTADGQEKWVWEQGRGMAGPDNQVRVLEGFITDITERKRAEQAVRTSEAKYRTLIENLEQSVFLKDRQLRFVAANRRFCQSLGCAEADIVGKTDFDFFPLALAEKLQADDRVVLHEGRQLEVEEEQVAEGKLPRTVHIVKTPVRDGQGQLEGVLGILWDVTEQRALEAQLRQSQKMEAVGRLAGGVAHDFNNLLTVISGCSEMLLRSVLPEDPAHGIAEEIRKAGERAASLTRQLLTFSRKQVVTPQVLNLNDLVAHTQKLLRRLIGEDIELTTVLDPNLGPVKVDPGQFEQVLLNLAVNARDAMPQGGRLTLQTANVTRNGKEAHPEEQAGPQVLLTVTDTGCGMSEQVKARIFEPFFTTKEMGKGTGLGLAIVYGIVKQSGGHIEVESQLEHGTTFQVYFPRAEAVPERESRAEVPPQAACITETVLLVEDDESVRGMVRKLLSHSGYCLLEASSGMEALRVSEQHPGPIHLLLTDVVMPQMSGRVLAERLAPLRPEMKVLYLSGYTDDAVVRHGVLEAGAPFLQKPFTLESLMRKVRAVLDQ